MTAKRAHIVYWVQPGEPEPNGRVDAIHDREEWVRQCQAMLDGEATEGQLAIVRTMCDEKVRNVTQAASDGDIEIVEYAARADFYFACGMLRAEIALQAAGVAT
jgi:hypothetical protein